MPGLKITGISSLQISAPLTFDWDKASEQKNVDSGIELYGIENNGGIKINYYGGGGTQCKLNFSRNNRLVEINGTCTGFGASMNQTSRLNTTSLKFHEACAVIF